MSATVQAERQVTAADVERVIAARKNKFQPLTVWGVFALPPPRWLIKGLFELGVLVAVYGPSGEGKTFVLLDWALSVALGREWMGHQVLQGPVVYVSGEGGRGIQKRIRAWMHDRGVKEIPHAYFILEAVQLTDEDDFEMFTKRLRELPTPPVLIIFDTLARCFVGRDENAAQDMGQLVEASRKLQEVIDVNYFYRLATIILAGPRCGRGCDSPAAS